MYPADREHIKGVLLANCYLTHDGDEFTATADGFTIKINNRNRDNPLGKLEIYVIYGDRTEFREILPTASLDDIATVLVGAVDQAYLNSSGKNWTHTESIISAIDRNRNGSRDGFIDPDIERRTTNIDSGVGESPSISMEVNAEDEMRRAGRLESFPFRRNNRSTRTERTSNNQNLSNSPWSLGEELGRLASYVPNTGNPHAVTREQVGLNPAPLQSTKMKGISSVKVVSSDQMAIDDSADDLFCDNRKIDL
jgi:hypothetical protein